MSVHFIGFRDSRLLAVYFQESLVSILRHHSRHNAARQVNLYYDLQNRKYEKLQAASEAAFQSTP